MQITGYQNFRVAMGPEPVAVLLQLRSQFEEVIDAAVKHYAGLAVIGKHGLMTGRAQIQNGQPPMAKPHPGPSLKTLRIGTAAG